LNAIKPLFSGFFGLFRFNSGIPDNINAEIHFFTKTQENDKLFFLKVIHSLLTI